MTDKNHSCMDHALLLREEWNMTHMELFESENICYCPVCDTLMKIHIKDTPKVYEVYSIRAGFTHAGIEFTKEDERMWRDRLSHYDLNGKPFLATKD